MGRRKDEELKITRGRTLRLMVSLLDEYGNPYTIQEGESLVFSVSDGASSTPILQKTGNPIVIYPSDTSNLDIGLFAYDVVLVKSNGDVYTVIPPDGGSGLLNIVGGVYEEVV